MSQTNVLPLRSSLKGSFKHIFTHLTTFIQITHSTIQNTPPNWITGFLEFCTYRAYCPIVFLRLLKYHTHAEHDDDDHHHHHTDFPCRLHAVAQSMPFHVKCVFHVLTTFVINFIICCTFFLFCAPVQVTVLYLCITAVSNWCWAAKPARQATELNGTVLSILSATISLNNLYFNNYNIINVVLDVISYYLLSMRLRLLFVICVLFLCS